MGVKLFPQFQVLPPEISHKRPWSVSLYIQHILSSNPHYMKKKNIVVIHNLRIKTNSFLTIFLPFFPQINSSNEKILSHQKRLGNFQVIFGKTTMIYNEVIAIYQSTRILEISLRIVASILLQLITTALITVICYSHRDNEIASFHFPWQSTLY